MYTELESYSVSLSISHIIVQITEHLLRAGHGAKLHGAKLNE